jgi:hypothetical protein
LAIVPLPADDLLAMLSTISEGADARTEQCRWEFSTRWVARPGAATCLTSGKPTTSGCSSIGPPTHPHDVAVAVRTPPATEVTPMCGTCQLSLFGRGAISPCQRNIGHSAADRRSLYPINPRPRRHGASRQWPQWPATRADHRIRPRRRPGRASPGDRGAA